MRQCIADLEMKGKVLIFVNTRQGAEELLHTLEKLTTSPIGCIHGEKMQYDRSDAMNRFKRGELRILIATDVAARGLDVSDIRTGRIRSGSRA